MNTTLQSCNSLEPLSYPFNAFINNMVTPTPIFYIKYTLKIKEKKNSAPISMSYVLMITV